MKKSLFIVLVLVISISAEAKVSLTFKSLKNVCTISDNQVTRTFSVGKDSVVGFSETSTIKTFGVEELARKAQDSSTGEPQPDSDFRFAMNLDGKVTHLNQADSTESLNLIQFMVKVCRF